MASLMPNGRQSYFDLSGNPLAGGKLYTYASGTDTPLATYTTAAGNVENANPVVLNSRGECSVFFGTEAYKVVLKDSSDVEIWTQDAIQVSATQLDLDGVETSLTSSINTVQSNLNTYKADVAQTENSAKGAALVGYYDSLAPTYLKTLSDIANGDEVSLFRFIAPAKHAGIRAFTNNDDLLTSLQDAFAAARSLYMPYGGYHVSGTLTASIQGFGLRGEGRVASQIISTVANLPTIVITAGLTAVTLRDFALDRNTTATNGGDGLQCLGTVGQATISNLRSIRNFRGFALGPTDYSDFKDSRAEFCQSIGVYMTNTAGDGACQWQLNNILSQRNGAQGFLLQTVAGPAGVTPGTWTNLATYANTGVGVGVVGLSGTPVNDIRMVGGFIGEDAASELYLDTYGGSHVITCVFAELAGRSATGPSLASPASGVGSGFDVTANNTDVQFGNCHSSANSLDGYYVNATMNTLGNCTAKNNGQQATAGRRNGVNTTAGRAAVSGGFYGNTGAGTSQTHGAFAADGNNLAVLGAYLVNNSTAPTGATANSTYIQQLGNLPNTVSSQIASAGAAGGLLVGGGATGGVPAAGVINVAGGLLKNNTAYTNP